MSEPIPSTPQGHSDAKQEATDPQQGIVLEVKIPPTHSCYPITCKAERDKWDIAKLVAEFVGLGFLIAYTVFAGQQVCEMREANKLTRDLVKDTYAADLSVGIGFSGDGTVNVGIENHGKSSTTSFSHYEIWIETREGKHLRSVKSETIVDRVPPAGRNDSMPNHYYTISDFSVNDLASYKNSAEFIKAGGIVRYEDGFGSTIILPFCIATSGFATMTCDGEGRYLRSLPPK